MQEEKKVELEDDVDRLGWISDSVEVALIPAQDQVCIRSSSGAEAVFFASRLLRHIRTQVHEAECSLFGIELVVEDALYLQSIRLKLDQQTWEQQLLRNHPNAEAFAALYGEHQEYQMSRQARLAELASNHRLLDRLKFFVHDLMKFGKEAQARLENSTAPFFMDEFYFSAEEVDILVNFPTESGLRFEEKLQRHLVNFAEVCSSHTLAPQFCEAFAIGKNFDKGAKFERAYKNFVKQRTKELQEHAHPTIHRVYQW